MLLYAHLTHDICIATTVTSSLIGLLDISMVTPQPMLGFVYWAKLTFKQLPANVFRA